MLVVGSAGCSGDGGGAMIGDGNWSDIASFRNTKMPINKPVILIGAGCPQSLAEKLCTLGIPCLVTWQAIDRVPENSPVFCGRPGVVGQRAANIIQQKADLLIIVGARLDTEQVGYRMDNFAPNARKVVYDVDRAELEKLPESWEKYQVDLNDPDIGYLYPPEKLTVQNGLIFASISIQIFAMSWKAKTTTAIM